MPIFDPANMANVKDSTAALVGVAQVRVAKVTSIRGVTTNNIIAPSTPLIPVGQSFSFLDATDGTTKIIRPAVIPAANASTGNPVATGTYTGAYDGNFIFVTESPTVCAVYAPDGSRTAGTLATGVITMAAVQGVTISGTISGTAANDTWVLPVQSPAAQTGTQTGIISPYSMFKGSTNSVGGLKDASWDPKIDSIATLESGFPATINDQIIAKVSSSMKFSAYEFTGATAAVLRQMLNGAMQSGDIIAVAAEIVFRDRKGGLVTYWCPSCTLMDAPSISPQNDFSTVPWTLRVNDQVEGSSTGTYQAWLRNMSMYYELTYSH